MGDAATRTYRPDDVAAVTALINAIEVHAGGRAWYEGDELGELIGLRVREPERDSRLVLGPDGTPIAAGFVALPPSGGHRVELWGGVSPGWRGRGIGRHLLEWQVARAHALHAELAPDAGWQAEVMRVVEDRDAERLHARFGFVPARYWHDMVATVADAPSLPLPDGLRIEPYRPEALDRLHEAHMEAFQDHWGYQRRGVDEWAAVTVRSAVFLPAMSVLGLDGDEVAGYVLGYRSAEPDALYVGHVGVRRPWRRRGLAAALLAHVLGLARAAGYRTASLGVDADSSTGAVGVYQRVGFGVAYRSVTSSLPIDGAAR